MNQYQVIKSMSISLLINRLTMTDYKSFAETLNYAEQSHSSLIHSVYLHCLLQIVSLLSSVDYLGF